MKNFSFGFRDIFLTAAASLFITVKCYGFLYGRTGWSGLDDFYAGVSIYENHNKYLDIYIYFLYLLLIFILYPVINALCCKTGGIFKNKNENKNEKPKTPEFKLLKKIQPFLPKLQRYQYLFVFGFIFLYPVNTLFTGVFYPKLAAAVFILMTFTAADIYYRNKNNKGFSPAALAALFFCLYFTCYAPDAAPSDDHHFGEKYAAFLMHSRFNLEYYKDIMLVHGRIDVIPAWLGSFFFNENNVYGYLLGEALNRNIIFIITMISMLYAAGGRILYAAPVLLVRVPSLSIMYASVFLLLIKEVMLKRPAFLFWFYIILSVLFSSFWTTIGCFWTIAAFPAFIYAVIKLNNRKVHLYTAVFVLFALSIIFRNTFFEYLYQAGFYIKGSLSAFGNNFGTPEGRIPFLAALDFIYKMSALLFVPFLIINTAQRLRRGVKDAADILLTAFTVLFVLVSLKYTLGRIDGALYLRAEYISQAFLCAVLPFLFYKYAAEKSRICAERILAALLVFAAIRLSADIPEKINLMSKTQYTADTILSNTGNIKLNPEHEKRLSEIKEFLNSKGERETFLDLTNRGMHYLYFDKAAPVIYTSYYNSISSKQAENSAERLKKNPPDNILVFSNNTAHDNIFPSLRINALYRWIFLKGSYKFYLDNNFAFLVKTKEKYNYTKEDFYYLDYYLASAKLHFLPEVWALSMKTLPLIKIMPDFILENYGNEIKIKFIQPQKVKDIDLLFLNTNIKNGLQNFKISINGSESKIECKSKSGKILAPMDNFPSWLLNEDLKEITIETNINVKTPEIEFYLKKRE